MRSASPVSALSLESAGLESASLVSAPSHPHLRRARVETCYLWRHRRAANLESPTRFTELVQVRKLADRDPRLVRLSCKITAKAEAERVLGSEWVVPTLWTGAALPGSIPFETPAMLKASHGCCQYRPLRRPPSSAEWNALARLTARWTARPYGEWLDEWCYRDVPRGLIAERLIGTESLPVDYKIYVFGSVATHVQVHVDRASAHRWVLHDRDFVRLVPGDAESAPRPSALSAMLKAAEALARGFSFARVDFYEVDGCPLFGEYCFYPGSGLDPFAADWIDFELGDLWRASLPRDGFATPRAPERAAPMGGT